MARTEEYRELDYATRYIVLDRDNYRCLICGNRDIQVHEIVPRSRFGARTMHICFQVRNRITLCIKHHMEAHTQEKRRQMLLMLAEKYGYTYDDSPFARYLIKT